MNTKSRKFLLNLRYALSANFVTLAISVLLNLFVPKYLGVKDYSFWQLYVFYSSYGALFHFGWLDGIYLKIGGEEYEDLDKNLLGSQFWYLFLFEIALSLLFFIVISILDIGYIKETILIFTIIVTIITIIKTYIMYIFQSTNRIKEYSQIARSDRYIYAFLVVSFILLGGKNFVYLIAMDIISKVIIVLWGLFKIKDIIFNWPKNFSNVKGEIFNNIKIGSSLMIGNYAGMFIIGIVRFFVERRWSIETFGKLSFTLSISNMFMMFINAAGVVIYPLLRRTDNKKLPRLYVNIRCLFVPISLFIMFFYFPIKFILMKWLPEYSDSLTFMGLLFPMIIYEGRTSLLISTYLKTIREEKIIMITNLITIIVSFIGSLITINVFDNLIYTVLVITVCLMLRCVLSEIILIKILSIKLDNSFWAEILITITFVVSNICFNSLISLIIYLIIYSIYFLNISNNFKSSILFLQSVMK